MPTGETAQVPYYRRVEFSQDGSVRAVVLAAGDGGRLGVHTASTPKPLVSVGGRPIISYTLDALRQAGVREAAVVLGYRGVQVRDALLRDPHGLRLDYAWNAEFHGGASLSLRAARSCVGMEPFLMVMADHMLSPGIIRRLLGAWRPGGPSLVATDAAPWHTAYVDEATRVAIDPASGIVTAIGKHIQPWDALDTGAFLLSPAVWQAVEAAPLDCELGEICARLAEARQLAAVDVTGESWYDIDTGGDLTGAGEMLAAGGAA
jgi:choline kinase